ncbi:hypothetical protein L1887_28710 [Cichorium endivia]|nr:hypothetical protein L1887_28710 [Cichorium endivia]
MTCLVGRLQALCHVPMHIKTRHSHPIKENDTANTRIASTKGRKMGLHLVDRSERPHLNARPKFLKRVLPLAVVISALVLFSLCVLTYIYYKRLVNGIAEKTQQNIELQLSNMRRVIKLLDPDHSIEDDTEVVDVPYFELDTLIDATQDFSEKNKLGQGGFWPVYKAWSLWTKQKPQVLKCIIIGLLCVQAQPDDGPSMANVIVMIGGEIYTLPTPEEPTVISGRDHATPSSSGLAKPSEIRKPKTCWKLLN